MDQDHILQLLVRFPDRKFWPLSQNPAQHQAQEVKKRQEAYKQQERPGKISCFISASMAAACAPKRKSVAKRKTATENGESLSEKLLAHDHRTTWQSFPLPSSRPAAGGFLRPHPRRSNPPRVLPNTFAHHLQVRSI